MLVKSLREPRYANPSETAIRCAVVLDGYDGEHDYVFADGDEAGQSYFDELKAGKHGAILPFAAPTLPPLTAAQLRAYANAKANAMRALARVYTLTPGLSVSSDATQGTGTDLIALKAWGEANGAATTLFVQNDGGVVTLTGTQSVELANAVLAYGQSVFATLASAMNGISNNTITTTAQIDALSWPA